MGLSAIAKLPYPELTDTPDVPRDMSALAARADALLDGIIAHATGTGAALSLPASATDIPGLSIPITKPGTYLMIATIDVAYLNGAVGTFTFVCPGGTSLSTIGTVVGQGAQLQRLPVVAIGWVVFLESPAGSGGVAAGSLVKVTGTKAAGGATDMTVFTTTSTVVAARVGV